MHEPSPYLLPGARALDQGLIKYQRVLKDTCPSAVPGKQMYNRRPFLSILSEKCKVTPPVRIQGPALIKLSGDELLIEEGWAVLCLL